MEYFYYYYIFSAPTIIRIWIKSAWKFSDRRKARYVVDVYNFLFPFLLENFPNFRIARIYCSLGLEILNISVGKWSFDPCDLKTCERTETQTVMRLFPVSLSHILSTSISFSLCLSLPFSLSFFLSLFFFISFSLFSHSSLVSPSLNIFVNRTEIFTNIFNL